MTATVQYDALAPAETGRSHRIAARVRRVVAPNPSAMTGPGTNTYLLGEEECLVIDPGPDEATHIDRIIELANGRVAGILCTHSHTDHSPGAARLKALTGATVYGLPAPDDEFQDESYAPDAGLTEGQAFSVGEDVLSVVHTPGHASNHVCFLLKSSGLLFTGDHLMSGSTVVILPPDGSMLQYLQSLRRLQTMPAASIAPGHGAIIPDAQSEIDRVIAHRLKREEKLVAALSARATATLDDVLPEVYDDVPVFMHPVARYSLLAHMIKLVEERRVEARESTAYRWLG
jgi:glyoxylase-like metal-dependent hydrolase (beta-lactamase superfamily II)